MNKEKDIKIRLQCAGCKNTITENDCFREIIGWCPHGIDFSVKIEYKCFCRYESPWFDYKSPPECEMCLTTKVLKKNMIGRKTAIMTYMYIIRYVKAINIYEIVAMVHA